jgi:2-C-methyl-D-erythritol 2,4-cyclodiphosphate synthase
VLGARSDELCGEQGITDSAAYLAEALQHLGKLRLTHVSVSIECSRPKLAEHIRTMRESVAKLCGLRVDGVGITATSGEGLTAFGRGEGVQAIVIVSADASSA